jgi:hypothetical protein
MRRVEAGVPEVFFLTHQNRCFAHRFVLRCFKTGLKCPGYGNRIVQAADRGTSSSFSISIVLQEGVFASLTPDESRAIHIYVQRVAPMLSGYFHDHFWSQLVLKLCSQEGAICHSIVALSLTFEQNCETDRNARTLVKEELIVHSYNKAIRSLISLDKTTAPLHIYLVACIIFSYVHNIRSQVQTAVGHIQSGVQLVNEWKPSDSRRFPLTIQQRETINHVLARIIAWLDLASRARCHFSSFQVRIISPPESIPFMFDSLTGSHAPLAMLFNLMDRCLRFIESHSQSKYQTGVTMNMRVEQLRLLQELIVWKTTYAAHQELTQPNTGTSSPMGATNSYFVMIYHLALNMWLKGALFTEETSWDNFKDDFEQMTSMLETIINDIIHCPEETSKQSPVRVAICHFCAS